MTLNVFRKNGSTRTWSAIVLILLAVGTAGGYFWFQSAGRNPINSSKNRQATANIEIDFVKMSDQARANLGLVSQEVQPQTYWRTLQTTGVIVDRPGLTDRGITSPVDCVISDIHAYEGDIVKPGDKLFSLRLASEYLQKAQSDYFKAISEIRILQKEIDRINNLADSGVIPEKRIIELNQNISRQQIEANARRQELLARGFNDDQLKQIDSGSFIKTIDIFAPSLSSHQTSKPKTRQVSYLPARQLEIPNQETFLELQNLKVELGQQVNAGRLLVVLANHHFLYIKGHAFRKEASSVARAAEKNWNVEVEFLEDAKSDWPDLEQTLQIRHLSNSIDAASRTFDYFIPLTNQSRTYQKEEQDFVVWRFRPGQQVRLHVPVEKMENVIVLPNEAVVYDGPNAYVFQQNGDFFYRIGVHVLNRDRLRTVIANDGVVLPGFFLAQNSAASLNRVLKVQSASGQSAANFHVHADGSVHANH
ncbi:MAG: MchE protein [Planctomycetota bacterium]